MKTNVKVVSPAPRTYEGAVASRINAEQELRRSVLSCLLWEDTFYEDGTSIADRIASLVPKVAPEKVAALAVEARNQQKLRHVPLLIASEMVKHASHKPFVAQTLVNVIQRCDELGESLSLYFGGKKTPIANQFKKGLAQAFKKFDEYAFGKYAGGAITPRDVMFLVHPVPESKEQERLWKKLADKKIAVPDTWETALSASQGENKKEIWTRLLSENKLFAMALLRNLRNCLQEGVDLKLIRKALSEMRTDKVLPYRFIAAARHAPSLEPELEAAMFRSLTEHEKLVGETVLLIDVSGSMDSSISSQSDLMRLDAACGLAMLLREICENVHVFTFSNDLKNVPARRGFALRDAIVTSQHHDGTELGKAVRSINAGGKHDRLIVITDEQSHDSVPNSTAEHAYMINVASYQNGVGYGKWTHIDGWSESCVKFIQEIEKPLEIPTPDTVHKHVRLSESNENKSINKTRKPKKFAKKNRK